MGNFTFENQGTTSFLVYTVDDGSPLDSLSLGMLTNNTIEGLVPMVYSQLDSTKYLKYNISSKISLQQFFQGVVNRRQIVGVFLSITRAMLNAEEYMLSQGAMILDMDRIYIEVGSSKAELICLPLMNKNTAVDMGSFFKNIIFSITYDQNENSDYVTKIINYLNSTQNVFSLVDFKRLLEQLEDEVRKPVNAMPQNVPDNRPQNNRSGNAPFNQGGMPGNMGSGQRPVQPQGMNGVPQQGGNGVPGGMNRQNPQGMQPNPQGMQPNQHNMNQQEAPHKEKKKLWPFGKKEKHGQQPQNTPAPGPQGVPGNMAIPGKQPQNTPVPGPQGVPGNMAIPGRQPQNTPASRPQGVPGNMAIPGRQPQNIPAPGPQSVPGNMAIPGRQPQNTPRPQGVPGNMAIPGGRPQNTPAQRQQGMPGNMAVAGGNMQQQPQNIKKEGHAGGIFGKKQPKNVPEQQDMPVSSIPQSMRPNNNVNNNRPQNVQGQVAATTVPQGARSMQGMNITGNANFGQTVVLNDQDQVGNTTVLGMDSSGSSLQPYLTRRRTGEKIRVKEPQFKIGREPSFVDYCVSDNTAISKSHAIIVSKNNQFYIIDTNSKNHTYIDDKMITSNEENLITSGCRIKLADEEFEFRMQ